MRELNTVAKWLNAGKVSRNHTRAVVMALVGTGDPELDEVLTLADDEEFEAARVGVQRLLEGRPQQVRLQFWPHLPSHSPQPAARSRRTRGKKIQRPMRGVSVVVGGRLADVVTYKIVRLLESGAMRVSRCPAPAPGDWSRVCNRWMVLGKRSRGRPAVYCSPACCLRASHKVQADTLKADARRR